METLEISGASALVSCADDKDRNPVSDVHKAIAIFDTSIEDYHDLIAGLHPRIIPYILPPHEDGIRTLTQILQRHNYPLSVHLVTHGAPGSLRLGNTELNLTTLRHYAEALGSWFQPNSELFLYACNVAAGDAGEELLAKLHQLTGVSIAASARRVGNVQQGGTWALDVVAGEMAIALPFSAATVASYPGTFPLAISGIDAAYDDVPDNTLTYTADEVADIDGSGTEETYTYNFPVGTQNNLIISGFEANAGADSFGFVQLVDQVRVERIDNAEVTGTREIFWYEREAIDTTGNVLDLRPSDVFSLEEALLSQTINRGADNVFANQGDINLNNIERVDFVESGGISAPATALDDIGFLLLERGGNDPITIAPITAVDVNGTPTAYGTLTTFAETEWGGSGINIETAVLNDLGTGNNQPGVSALPGAQEISGIFVSFTDLGIGANQQFFGYSVFPGDVATDLVGLSDANTSTSSATGEGGLDLVAGGALFLRSGANIPPVLDLDPSNTTGGANNGNFQATFTSGGVDIAAPNATGFDPDNVGADIETLTITVDVFNGANEILDIGGTPLTLTNGASTTATFGSTTFDVAVSVAGGTATVAVTNSTPGDIPNVDIQQFLRSLAYNNTSATPNTTPRVFSFTANDGVAGSNAVTSTISFTGAGANTAPILNLDPNNVTGGADNRNFDTTFTAGGNAVEITADDATAVDPDNSGVDIETLTIAVNTPDGADEVLSFAGTPITLTNGTTQTVTFGSSTFDIAVTGTVGNATVTLTNNAGGTIPNVDLRTLLRSLTYDNTSANPDTTDRVFSFIAEDGEANSNTVTSTVTFATTTNTPPVLNLDPDNVTGGVNNRNFEATFNAGGGAVDITADAATAVDPDNSGVDIETLAISVNVPNGANEILSFGGTSLALTNGATTTVTFGSTTFEIAVAVNGGNATVSIDSSSGGDIPNTALRRLLRSLSYNNTSASPDQTDRVFTFIANDGLTNSNTVISTISVEGGTTPPPNRDCSGGLRLAGTATNNRLEGSARTDIIRGFAGNDEMLGLACPDRLLGGAGNDRLFGGGASDTLDGGAGRDRLSGQNGADILFGRGGTDRLNGGRGNDQLSGQAGLDYLRGKAGADQLRGGQGGDGMAGGAGRDRLFGGGGNDRMFGGSGRDRMRGNARADRMFGGGGADRMFGQNGRDLLRGEAGRDILQGGAGNDRMLGGADNDRLFGGARNDVLSGGQGADRVLGQRGDDQLRGGQQNDRLSGGSGNDRAAGGTGNDQVLGGSGSDTLRGNLGADRLFGGTGSDQLFGGRGNDRIDGGSQNDVLRGNLGADVLFGRGGFDTLRGGQGFDRLNGGGGKDRVFGGRGNDRIDGASQNDTLRGNVGADLVLGKAGNDVIQGDRGFDRLNGGGGNDTLNGGGAADILSGKAGRDRLEGLSGNDQLFGNNGRDTLVGGSGNDLLVGKAEGDTLQGDRGADRFAFSGATVAEALRDSLVGDTDRILDFDQTEGDRFDINVTGGATAIPSALFNVGQVAGPNLQAAATRAFRDRNPNRAGNQRLGAQQAMFFDWRGQSYLLVNNSNRSFNALQDLVVNVTGIELGAGDANRVSLTVNDYFA
ncbi:DUF4347 domain-containing protein [Vacuolonema iberomarrocanum]|uniref:DUF4347 domain-containing protein n=1 Tax=Vacuolonema iberomarrocanum TaxID=3454632 RepID=UPI0019FC0DD7|nr:DUF4347 domain-containing protein [filamentous cyanobacterium LEGE 07170]